MRFLLCLLFAVPAIAAPPAIRIPEVVEPSPKPVPPAPAKPVAVPVPVTSAYDGVGCGVARMLQRAASFVLQVVARHHMGAACCTEPPSAPRPRRYRQATPTYQPVAFLFHFIPHTPFC